MRFLIALGILALCVPAFAQTTTASNSVTINLTIQQYCDLNTPVAGSITVSNNADGGKTTDAGNGSGSITVVSNFATTLSASIAAAGGTPGTWDVSLSGVGGFNGDAFDSIAVAAGTNAAQAVDAAVSGLTNQTAGSGYSATVTLSIP